MLTLGQVVRGLRAAAPPSSPHPRGPGRAARAADRHQVAEADRLVALGARRVDWDGYPGDPDFVVLADPDENLFCIVDPGHPAR